MFSPEVHHNCSKSLIDCVYDFHATSVAKSYNDKQSNSFVFQHFNTWMGWQPMPVCKNYMPEVGRPGLISYKATKPGFRPSCLRLFCVIIFLLCNIYNFTGRCLFCCVKFSFFSTDDWLERTSPK